jgi:seryl-tRNA synthetase
LIGHLERMFVRLARRFGAEPRRYGTMIPLAVLRRTDYLASFPMHACFVTRLRGTDQANELVSSLGADNGGSTVSSSLMADAELALPSAVCYHAYAEYEGAVIADDTPVLLTAQGTCFRSEDSFVPLMRQSEFTMRELIVLGAPDVVEHARLAVLREVLTLATRCGFRGRVAVATDPFFGVASGRGRALFQRARELKYELLVELPGLEHGLAVASFNLHQDYFGRAFDIRRSNGEPCWTCCVAFGLERWLAATYAYSGEDPAGWGPLVESDREPTKDPCQGKDLLR